MTAPSLVSFIKEARRRGFDDYEIKAPLLKKGWPIHEIEQAFSELKQDYKFKNKVCIYLDSDILKILEKRAKRNMFNLHEMIEDILRRSCTSSRNIKKKEEKLDDLLVSLFSRKRTGKKK